MISWTQRNVGEKIFEEVSYLYAHIRQPNALAASTIIIMLYEVTIARRTGPNDNLRTLVVNEYNNKLNKYLTGRNK